VPVPGCVLASRPMASPEGYVDGRYRIIAQVGHGGMGVVYKALHALTGRLCALKLLKPAWVGNTEITQRFFFEARATTRIVHPNIVEVFDAGYSSAGPYLAMEWLEGETLASLLRREGRLSLEQSLAVIRPVVSALAAVHETGIIHRDIKPANLFLTVGSHATSRNVKVLDFGVAKILELSSMATESGRVLGTTEYLSPEQVQGAELDGRSDLFALGVVLFQLLTGTSPFRGPTAVATSYRIVHADLPDVSSAGGPADVHLQSIVARLLAKRISERFANATELERALDELLPDLRSSDALASLTLRAQGELEPERVSGEFSFGSPDGPKTTTTTSITDRVPSPSHRTSVAPMSGDLGAPPPEQRPVHRPSQKRFQPRLSGRVLRALNRTTLMRHGTDVATTALEFALTGPSQRGVVNIDPRATYEIAAFDRYRDAIVELVGPADLRYWHEHGQASIEAELVMDFRSVLRSDEPSSLAESARPLWASLFDFGQFGLRRRDQTLEGISVADFHPASEALQTWVGGMIEQTFRSSGFSTASVRVTTFSTPNVPLALTVSW
jgi:eukaryotic-like serine/threonine-protein kinase